jgi:DNA-directed RNA polymerase subunit K/omega
MIRRPYKMGAFEFVAIAARRAAQLARGCRPRVEGDHSTAVLARREVAEGKVTRTADVSAELLRDEHGS